MLYSLLLPKFSPPRPVHLYSVKVCVSLCALFLLLLPLPSYAGHWVITLNGNTTAPGTTGVGNYTFANSQVTGPAPWSSTQSPYFSVSGSSCALGLPGSLSATATLTWTPDSPTDTSQPPPTVDVLETASAGGSEWMLQPTGVSTSAFDGLGDAATYATAPVYGASSSGKHLYHMTVSPGQMSVTLPNRYLIASLSYATAITTSGTNEGMGYAVQIDTRKVFITCPTIETSYFKGIIDANHPNGAWPEVRDPSGSAYTDSAVSPPLTQPGAPTTSWTASPTLLGQAPGFQSPVFAWSNVAAGTLSASGNTSSTQLSVQFPVSATSTALKQQSTVILKVTDTDGGSGTNSFTIRWHYPYENWATSGSQSQDSPIAFPSSTGPQAVNGQVSIPVTSAASGISWNVAGKVGGGILGTAGAAIGIAQPETDPVIIGFFSATSYTLSVLDPPSTPPPYVEQGTPGEFQTDVATQVSINHSNTSGIFLPSRPRMDPGLAASVDAAGNYGSYTSDTGGTLTFDVTAYREQLQQNYTGDSYGQKGYLGPAAGSVVFGGPWMYVWDWFWTSTSNPTAS